MIEKMLKKRFGTIAVNKGFISEEQLKEALAIQAQENIGRGTHRLIGQILLERGFIKESQIDEVLETMSNSIMYSIGVSR